MLALPTQRKSFVKDVKQCSDPTHLEGISKASEIAQGLLEAANDGVLLIPEFKKTFSKFQLFREALDCDWIDLSKRGITKRFRVNTTFLCGANPRHDFFPEGGKMRSAIPFEEGDLSRFDIMLPLIMDVEKNKSIAERLELFGGSVNSRDFEKIQLYLKTLSEGMMMFKGVKINVEQEKRLKEAYVKFNKSIGNRTLVILRDMETLCRLVNVVTMSVFYDRADEDGVVIATDIDIDKAIQLWETLIYTRQQIYVERGSKELMTPREAILKIIKEAKDGMSVSQSLPYYSTFTL